MIKEPVILPSSRMRQVEEYYFSRKLKEIASLRAEGKKVINLGIGSPDQAPDEEVIETLIVESRKKDIHGYQSYLGLPELRSAFAHWYKMYFNVVLNPASEILPLIGSKEGIMHISMTYLEPGDEVLVPDPGYPAYAAVAKLTGATIRNYELVESKNWQADLELLSKTDLSRVKLMWLNYPNMPTGAPADKAYFTALVQFARENQILLVNDNPYTFVLNPEKHSLLSVPGSLDVALELNSLSKAHNLAGWRIGMLAGRADYLAEILRFKSNMDSGMFYGIQKAAISALQLPESWYDKLNEVYMVRRKVAEKVMDLLGCVFSENQVGMFLWAKIPEQYENAYQLADRLLYETNLFITPGGIFGDGGLHYLRISLCSPVEDFNEAIDRIHLSELKV
ncbi:MAG: aminotransferase class I/II-fold pyridoxal phosphate-dependent enzyme [Bacteroidetes bacterium]|nr:aminotransferase class I/II-fold pyridoxal phosphate-dependent enzyme [Bacteroidota bacterium]